MMKIRFNIFDYCVGMGFYKGSNRNIVYVVYSVDYRNNEVYLVAYDYNVYKDKFFKIYAYIHEQSYKYFTRCEVL